MNPSKQYTISRIKDLLGIKEKEIAIIWQELGKSYFKGETLSQKRLNEIQRTHKVIFMKWIEEDCDIPAPLFDLIEPRNL